MSETPIGTRRTALLPLTESVLGLLRLRRLPSAPLDGEKAFIVCFLIGGIRMMEGGRRRGSHRMGPATRALQEDGKRKEILQSNGES